MPDQVLDILPLVCLLLTLSGKDQEDNPYVLAPDTPVANKGGVPGSRVQPGPVSGLAVAAIWGVDLSINNVSLSLSLLPWSPSACLCRPAFQINEVLK